MKLASRGGDPFIVRLPDGLRARIKEKAKENLRSMNSEIVFQLSQLYPANEGTKKGDVSAS